MPEFFGESVGVPGGLGGDVEGDVDLAGQEGEGFQSSPEVVFLDHLPQEFVGLVQLSLGGGEGQESGGGWESQLFGEEFHRGHHGEHILAGGEFPGRGCEVRGGGQVDGLHFAHGDAPEHDGGPHVQPLHAGMEEDAVAQKVPSPGFAADGHQEQGRQGHGAEHEGAQERGLHCAFLWLGHGLWARRSGSPPARKSRISGAGGWERSSCGVPRPRMERVRGSR